MQPLVLVVRQRRQDASEGLGVPFPLEVTRAADGEGAAPGIGRGDDRFES